MATNPLLGRSFRSMMPSASTMQSPFLSPLAALSATAAGVAHAYGASTSTSPLSGASAPVTQDLFRRPTRAGFDAKWQMYGQLAPARNQRNGFNAPAVEPPQQTNFAGSLANRFAPGSPLSQAAGVVEGMLQQQSAGQGVVMQPGGYGSPLQFQPQRNPNDVMQEGYARMQEALQAGGGRTYNGPFIRDTGDGLAYTSRAQALRDSGFQDQADFVEEGTRSRNQAMWDRRAAQGQEGRGSRVFDRRRRAEESRLRGQRQQAIRNGIDPGSSRAAGLFPELYQQTIQNRRAAQGSPLSQMEQAAPLVPPNAPKTAQSVMQAQNAIGRLLTQNPLFQQMGVTPGEDGTLPPALDVATAFYSQLMENPSLDLSDKDLQDLQDLSSQYQQQHTGEGGLFDGGIFTRDYQRRAGELFGQLGQLPRNDPQARRTWLQNFRGSFPRPQVPPSQTRPSQHFERNKL